MSPMTKGREKVTVVVRVRTVISRPTSNADHIGSVNTADETAKKGLVIRPTPKSCYRAFFHPPIREAARAVGRKEVVIWRRSRALASPERCAWPKIS